MGEQELTRVRIEGVTVWDGDADLGPCSVTWEDGRITAVTPADRDQHRGLALIPGIVDAHVHLSGPATTGDFSYASWPLLTLREEQVLHGVGHARALLSSGITTVREMASDQRQIALRNAVNQGIVTGPRILAFCPVGMTAGHQDLFVPPPVAERPPTADGPDACRSLVRSHARLGADGIKICTSGGVLSSGDRNEWRNYTAAELTAIVDEAHALDLPVAAHAHTATGIQRAIDIGVDSLEHGTLMTSAQAGSLAKASTPVSPTLLINNRIAEGRTGAPAESQRKAASLVGSRDDLLRAAHGAGVRFILGTDSNGYHLPMGAALDECGSYREVLGMDSVEVLRAATSDAAAAIGLGQTAGRVARGYAADLVLVHGRPWEDVSQLTPKAVRATVVAGETVHGDLP